MAHKIDVLRTFTKDPDAELVYTFDWINNGPNDATVDDKGWLQSAIISTSTFILPADLTNVVDSNTTTTASIKLSGGRHGKNYIVTNRIVSNLGEKEDRSIEIKVRHR